MVKYGEHEGSSTLPLDQESGLDGPGLYRNPSRFKDELPAGRLIIIDILPN